MHRIRRADCASRTTPSDRPTASPRVSPGTLKERHLRRVVGAAVQADHPGGGEDNGSSPRSGRHWGGGQPGREAALRLARDAWVMHNIEWVGPADGSTHSSLDATPASGWTATRTTSSWTPGSSTPAPPASSSPTATAGHSGTSASASTLLTQNRMAPAGGNPVSFVEVDGHWVQTLFGAAVGGGVNLGVRLWRNGGRPGTGGLGRRGGEHCGRDGLSALAGERPGRGGQPCGGGGRVWSSAARCRESCCAGSSGERRDSSSMRRRR